MNIFPVRRLPSILRRTVFSFFPTETTESCIAVEMKNFHLCCFPAKVELEKCIVLLRRKAGFNGYICHISHPVIHSCVFPIDYVQLSVPVQHPVFTQGIVVAGNECIFVSAPLVCKTLRPSADFLRISTF
jgi:hypothetical protein